MALEGVTNENRAGEPTQREFSLVLYFIENSRRVGAATFIG